MPEFLSITKASTECTNWKCCQMAAGAPLALPAQQPGLQDAVGHNGSLCVCGGQHGFETDRPPTALRVKEPALRGPPAQPEAPREPAALGQEHWWPPSDDKAPGGLGTIRPATWEAPRVPQGALPCRRWASENPHGPSPEAAPSPEVQGLGCAFSSRRETEPGQPGRQLPHRCCNPARQEVKTGDAPAASQGQTLCPPPGGNRAARSRAMGSWGGLPTHGTHTGLLPEDTTGLLQRRPADTWPGDRALSGSVLRTARAGA